MGSKNEAKYRAYAELMRLRRQVNLTMHGPPKPLPVFPKTTNPDIAECVDTPPIRGLYIRCI